LAIYKQSLTQSAMQFCTGWAWRAGYR